MGMKLKGALCGLAAVAMIIGGVKISAAEPINVLGIETNQPWAYDILDFIPGLTFTKVSESAFASVNLNSFNELFISDNPGQSTINALNARKNDLSTWVSAGHGIFALALTNPFTSNQYDWVPDAIRPAYISFTNDIINIANPSHPVMAGLTDDGLSGWHSSAHGIFENSADPLTWGPNVTGWDVLAREPSDLHGAVTLATSFGLGRLVLTLQDPDEHHSGLLGPGFPVKEDQLRFVQNGITWVAGTSAIVDPGLPIVDPGLPSVGAPEPASLLLLGSGLALLFAWQLRRKITLGHFQTHYYTNANGA